MIEHSSLADKFGVEISSTPDVSRSAAVKRYFLFTLLLSTWIPFAFFILLAPAEGAVGSLALTKTMFLFLGTAHVPATLFFYGDKEFAGVIERHRLRYIYAPIFLAVATGLIFVVTSPTVQIFTLLFYWAWQAFHYGRQNIGIYAFASIAQTGSAPHRMEKLAIDLGTALGILGTFKIFSAAIASPVMRGAFDQLSRFGYIAFAGVFVFSLVVYLKFFRGTTIFKTIFFFTCVFFFFPVFISTDMNVAFFSYAIAHGLQYLIFISVISMHEGRRAESRAIQSRSVLKLLVFVLVLGFIFFRGGELRTLAAVKDNALYLNAANFIFGALLGLTMAHFVVDGGAWKLSQVLQRAYITRRFGFIFEDAAARKVRATAR
jgi:hypothetical protein